eukprot:TRINITY_DN3353_c0_g1_i1.p1 TRINITY_DN3353_c0_g1~~TRINITY_DN3353_c0_g1_i1.p1  ORF type:complete len:402 (+),score=67.64 TRINITY_DN3353_c0_g1_i1:51-1256(+)
MGSAVSAAKKARQDAGEGGGRAAAKEEKRRCSTAPAEGFNTLFGDAPAEGPRARLLRPAARIQPPEPKEEEEGLAESPARGLGVAHPPQIWHNEKTLEDGACEHPAVTPPMPAGRPVIPDSDAMSLASAPSQVAGPGFLACRAFAGSFGSQLSALSDSQRSVLFEEPGGDCNASLCSSGSLWGTVPHTPPLPPPSKTHPDSRESRKGRSQSRTQARTPVLRAPRGPQPNVSANDLSSMRTSLFHSMSRNSLDCSLPYSTARSMPVFDDYEASVATIITGIDNVYTERCLEDSSLSPPGPYPPPLPKPPPTGPSSDVPPDTYAPAPPPAARPRLSASRSSLSSSLSVRGRSGRSRQWSSISSSDLNASFARKASGDGAARDCPGMHASPALGGNDIAAPPRA